MNSERVPAPSQPEFNPLREYGLGPFFLLVYASMLVSLQFLLVGYGKKSAVSC